MAFETCRIKLQLRRSDTENVAPIGAVRPSRVGPGLFCASQFTSGLPGVGLKGQTPDVSAPCLARVR